MHKFILVLSLLLFYIHCDPNNYCSNITSSCPQEYIDQPFCLKLVAKLPAGDDVKGNTLACRQNILDTSTTSDPHYCLKAGPIGGGVCGNFCTVYCDLHIAICNKSHFEDFRSCLKICQYVSNNINFYPHASNETVDHTNITSGNSLDCRFHYLLEEFQKDDNVKACNDSGPDGGNVCGDINENYQHQLKLVCPNQFQETELFSVLVKSLLPEDLSCRMNFIRKVIINEDKNQCKKASIITDSCEDQCQTFCKISNDICGTTLFSSVEECLNNCSNMRKDGNLGDKVGNTIHCRLFHIKEIKEQNCSSVNFMSCIDTAGVNVTATRETTKPTRTTSPEPTRTISPGTTTASGTTTTTSSATSILIFGILFVFLFF